MKPNNTNSKSKVLKERLFSISIIMVTLCLFGCYSAIAAALPLSKHGEGVILNNVSDYDWWYGCSPTSAGMMMAYYDINGYDGLLYDNLVPGGQAELSSFPSTPGQWDYLAQSAIASPEHVSDFYVSGYDRSGDDVRGTRHDFDSLADFMGTSQDSAGNTIGWTTFWFYNDGSPLYAAGIYAEGAYYYETDGMFGMWEYFNYARYGAGTPDSNLFNILSHRNQPADVCPECDLDGDGMITALDARKLVLLCTCPRCVCP